MQELKLHSFGQNDHLETLKKKYDSKKKKVEGNINISEVEKNAELNNLTDSFKKEKKDIKNNLY